jgi:hypothetical protein
VADADRPDLRARIAELEPRGIALGGSLERGALAEGRQQVRDAQPLLPLEQGGDEAEDRGHGHHAGGHPEQHHQVERIRMELEEVVDVVHGSVPSCSALGFASLRALESLR